MHENLFERIILTGFATTFLSMPAHSDQLSRYGASDANILGDESCPSSLVINGTADDFSDITGEGTLSSHRIVMPFTTMDWECAETRSAYTRNGIDGVPNSKIPDSVFKQESEIIMGAYPRRFSPDAIIRGYAVDAQLGADPSISIFSISTPQDKTVPEFLIIHKEISLSAVLPTMEVDAKGLPIKTKYGFKPNRVFYTDLIHRFDLLTHLEVRKYDTADTVSAIKLLHFSDNSSPVTYDNGRENPLGNSWINGLLNKTLTSLDTTELSLEYIPYSDAPIK